MKTTVEIADPLFEEAKRIAEAEGCTLRDLIENGLRSVLDERKRARAKPFKLRDASVGGEGLEPGIREDKIRWYAYIGSPGFPETVDEVNAMLDEMYPKERK